MAIVVSCDCGKQFRTKDEHAGRKGRCPECGGLIAIPAATPVMGAGPPPSVPTPPPILAHSPVPPPPVMFTPQCPKIYTDYGVAYSRLARSAAQQQGLRYFNGRWVGVADYTVLRREQAVISSIRLLWILSVIGTTLVVVFGLLALMASAPLPGEIAGNIAAVFLLAVVLSGGTAALWYFTTQWNQVCRWILVGLHGLGVLAQLIVAAAEASSSSVPGVILLVTLVQIAVQVIIIWILVCPAANKLFTYNQTH